MCFYKDTQALLAKNTLRQFFIKKVADHAGQQQNLKSNQNAVPLPNSNELIQGELPYKKMQMNTDLFKDLVKLSHGDATEPESGDDMLVSPKVTQNNNSSPLPQNINIKIEENAEDQSKQKNAPEISLEEVLSMVEKTNNVLADFKTTQDGFLKKIQELSQEAKHMDIEESPFERLNRMSRRQQQDTVKISKNPSYKDMLASFTRGRTEFPYALRLSAKLPSPVLREKNVKISVELVRTSDGAPIENHGSMLLQISLFTWELPANPILRNRAGNKVLQGEDECELKNGQGSFDKLQINEVTSKFINGYIAVLIVPKRPINFGTSLESLQQKNLFKIQDIKPLLIEKVVIKSKKKTPKA